MGDRLRTGELSWYITDTKVDSAFYPSGVHKLSTSLPAVVNLHLYQCRVAGNTL